MIGTNTRSLDCLTPEGQKWIARQSRIVKIIAQTFGVSAIEMSHDPAATIDVQFYRDSHLKAIAEIKCRNMSLDQLRSYGSYLITDDKLSRGADISRTLEVPMYLFVGLRRDHRIVYWKVTDHDGASIINIDRRSTFTKRTCNDARPITRMNAYLPLSSMHELQHAGDTSW